MYIYEGFFELATESWKVRLNGLVALFTYTFCYIHIYIYIHTYIYIYYI